MNTIVFSILFFGYFVSISLCDLKLVVEIFRHGARTSLHNEFSNYNFPGYLPGELSPTGMRQHYILGAQMRERYIENQNFLSQYYSPEELYVQSDNCNRTIRSAQSHLLGMFQFQSEQNFSQSIAADLLEPPFNQSINQKQIDFQDNKYMPHKFQSFPIHVIQDDAFNANQYCVLYNEWQKKLKKSDLANLAKELFTDNTFKTLSEVYNKTVDFNNFNTLMDFLLSIQSFDMPWPEQLTTPEMLYNLTFLTQIYYQNYWSGSEEEKVLLTIPALAKIFYFINNKVNQPENPLKYVILSAHDSTLEPLMASLNFTSPRCLFKKFFPDLQNDQIDNLTNSEYNCVEGYPYFASQMIFELYEGPQNTTSAFRKLQQEQNYYIKVLYNGQYMNLCNTNDSSCNYDQFLETIQPLIDYNQYNQTCQPYLFNNITYET